ncbi:oxysterol-binding protein-related protein 3a isoform X2 [Brachyhypopomus gauderio]|uniref:oxysterol-binding protein-related protein 3a isoform X2 n=1 Tax=Brachyhypopomus gauderio TaxID=698409 RepID=UPI0040416AD5
MSAEDPSSPPSPLIHSSASATSLPLSEDSDVSPQDHTEDGWEVVDSLRGAWTNLPEPSKQEGVLLKRRKWPMKGWHKRYFLLDKGILMYGKMLALKKGKVRGRIDVGLSVMSIKKKTMCIDLDTGDSIYHLKVKPRDVFDEWVSQLRNHRVFRQNEIVMDPPEHPVHSDSASIRKRAAFSKQRPLLKNTLLQSSEDMKKCCRDLSECESSLLELNLLLKNLQVLHHQTFSTPAPTITVMQTEGNKNDKKGQRKWRSRAHRKKGKSALRTSVSHPSQMHMSNPNLTHTVSECCSDSPDSAIDAPQLQEDFCRMASTIHATLRAAYSSLCAERDRFTNTLEQKSTRELVRRQGPSHTSTFVSDVGDSGVPEQADKCSPLRSTYQDVCDGPRPLLHQVSSENRGSVPESLHEFFDAKEYLLSSSSSENEVSDNDSCLSDVSDNVSEEICDSEKGTEKDDTGSSVSVRTRRMQLPSPCVSAGVNLWSILSSNIGKDLSKVAMPVQLNEPINTLQRLCEEMEYCHLLDTAAHTHDPYMRMVYVAAFAVSAYAYTHTRAGRKPFNPLLGETYECERVDKGFSFISEQVSHHPPISACHCESKNFTVWQDVRWKNKFWGKSMEIVPMGTTHVVLPRFADHYELSRVTSCIHNILSGQRWVEHYGDVTIRNVSATEDPVLCKITFIKSRSQGSSSNEVQATVTDSEGHVIHSLFGKWHEALYLGDPPSAICLWRASPLPQNCERFYGFTQFAIELNELDESIQPFLPVTDTRFRPDQRLLEEGDVSGAEEQKEKIEVLQRERSRVLQENNTPHTPRFFTRTENGSWTSNGTYWELRRDPGFSKLQLPVLW